MIEKPSKKKKGFLRTAFRLQLKKPKEYIIHVKSIGKGVFIDVCLFKIILSSLRQSIINSSALLQT